MVPFFQQHCFQTFKITVSKFLWIWFFYVINASQRKIGREFIKIHGLFKFFICKEERWITHHFRYVHSIFSWFWNRNIFLKISKKKFVGQEDEKSIKNNWLYWKRYPTIFFSHCQPSQFLFFFSNSVVIGFIFKFSFLFLEIH